MQRLTGTAAKDLMEAYNSIYQPANLNEEYIVESFNVWVNSLLDEGYDLSDHTYDDLYETYIVEFNEIESSFQIWVENILNEGYDLSQTTWDDLYEYFIEDLEEQKLFEDLVSFCYNSEIFDTIKESEIYVNSLFTENLVEIFIEEFEGEIFNYLTESAVTAAPQIVGGLTRAANAIRQFTRGMRPPGVIPRTTPPHMPGRTAPSVPGGPGHMPRPNQPRVPGSPPSTPAPSPYPSKPGTPPHRPGQPAPSKPQVPQEVPPTTPTPPPAKPTKPEVEPGKQPKPTPAPARPAEPAKPAPAQPPSKSNRGLIPPLAIGIAGLGAYGLSRLGSGPNNANRGSGGGGGTRRGAAPLVPPAMIPPFAPKPDQRRGSEAIVGSATRPGGLNANDPSVQKYARVVNQKGGMSLSSGQRGFLAFKTDPKTGKKQMILKQGPAIGANDSFIGKAARALGFTKQQDLETLKRQQQIARKNRQTYLGGGRASTKGFKQDLTAKNVAAYMPKGAKLSGRPTGSKLKK